MQSLKAMKGKSGQGLVEYIILICLIAVFVFGVVQRLGRTTQSKFTDANTKISQL